MQAIILAGGLGTRLRAAVSGTPKSMALIHGVPFLEILVRHLAGQGVEKVVLATGYLAEQIIEHFSGMDHPGLSVAFHREERPLGTGGAIFSALDMCDCGDVLVFNGDTYVDLDLAAFRKSRVDHNAALAMCLVRASDTRRYGAVSISEDGWIESFGEKSHTGPGLINAGAYVFDRNLLTRPPIETPFSFEVEVIAPMVQSRKVLGFETSGRFIDIGIPDDYHVAQQLLRDAATRVKSNAETKHLP
jgi:D-glycero-alpha-D-manno-heptose 1-phosphate guanylyltransferase